MAELTSYEILETFAELARDFEKASLQAEELNLMDIAAGKYNAYRNIVSVLRSLGYDEDV